MGYFNQKAQEIFEECYDNKMPIKEVFEKHNITDKKEKIALMSYIHEMIEELRES